MAYLFKNYEEVLRSEVYLEDQFTDIICDGRLDSMVERLGASDVQVVRMVSDLVYDNPILNHPKLLEEASKICSLPKLLDLGRSLDSGLVAEASETGDASTILAGLLSLSPEEGY